MAAGADTLAVTIKRKEYHVDQTDLPKLKAAVIAAWKPTLRSLRNNVNYAGEMWKSHHQLREDSFFTSRVIETVGRASFPPEGMIKSAETALGKLEQTVSSGNFGAIDSAYQSALKSVSDAVTAMQKYNESISTGG